MDKLAVETRAASPTPWTHLLSTVAAFVGKRLIGRPKHGAVTITFPNGKVRTFGDPSTGVHARLTLHNFKVLQKTLQRGTVGFADQLGLPDLLLSAPSQSAGQAVAFGFDLLAYVARRGQAISTSVAIAASMANTIATVLGQPPASHASPGRNAPTLPPT